MMTFVWMIQYALSQRSKFVVRKFILRIRSLHNVFLRELLLPPYLLENFFILQGMHVYKLIALLD